MFKFGMQKKKKRLECNIDTKLIFLVKQVPFYLFFKVFPSSPVLVVSGQRQSSLTPGLAVYPVRVVNFTSLQQTASPIFINISCALTSQSEAVLVRALKDKSGTGEHWGLWFLFFFFWFLIYRGGNDRMYCLVNKKRSAT